MLTLSLRPPARLAVLLPAGSLSLVVLACGGEEGGRADVTGIGPGIDSLGTGIDTLTTGGDDEQADTGDKLDVAGGSATVGGGDCPGGSGMPGDIEFSNIWIANTPEGTVSKIDTQTGVELARYRTGAASNSDPSRTSVNLLGDVAVVNRAGGSVIKIAAVEDRCVDHDGDGSIRTSTGPNDVLPWGEDECVLWETPLLPGARAAAWDSGNDPSNLDNMGCQVVDPNLWVSAMDGSNTVHVWRLDGDTGATLHEVTLPGWTGGWGGVYGGAVDRERGFWAPGKDNTVLVHVDAETFALTVHDAPGYERFYGIAMDADGTPWVASEFDDRLVHFDRASEQFVDHGTTGHGSLRGLAIDAAGNAWIAANNPCDLVRFDRQTGAYANIALAGCGTPVGVSIDVEGYVWVVDQGSNRAYKVDPATHAVVTTVTGLAGPYTYSDMTGSGLSLVTNPPPA
jgi:sugar lactone lactonase YvrE